MFSRQVVIPSVEFLRSGALPEVPASNKLGWDIFLLVEQISNYIKHNFESQKLDEIGL